MKFRRDFVTNSSSSSFIFSKTDENMNIDTIYHIIRAFYIDFLNLFNKIKINSKEHGLRYDSENGSFELLSDDIDPYDKLKELGLHPFDSDKKDFTWLKFETYVEYIDYWGKNAPFTIINLHNSLLERNKKYDDELDEIDELAQWYIRCYYDKFYPDISSFSLSKTNEEIFNYVYCGDCSLGFGSEKCKIFLEGVKVGKITKNNIVTAILGDFCIFSYEGYIPYTVVHKLEEIALFSCNHMG